MLVDLDENGFNAHAKKTGEDFDLHDKINEAYEGTLGEAFKSKTRKRIDWIVGQIHGNRILDVGCSQGIVPLLLARKGKRVVGVDIDKKVINDANKAKKRESKETQKNLTFLQDDFLKADFKSQKYDTIIFTEFLEHLYEPEKFIAKASELSSPDGRIVVTVPFGINDHPDHRQNFYLTELYEMISKYFDIKSVQIIEKWIGFTATKKNKGIKSITPSPEMLFQAEKAFYGIERSLVDKVENLKVDINKLKDRNKELEHYKAASFEHQSEAKRYREQRNMLRNSYSYRLGRRILYPARRIFAINAIRRTLLFIYFFVFPDKKKILSNSNIRYGNLFRTPSKKNFVLRDSAQNKDEKVRVAAVMDEFTYNSFKYESDIEQLTPDRWKKQISDFKPDLLLIESAWRGKDGLWRDKVSRGPKHILEVIRYCQKLGIPTAFWNKEDPAHTASFLPIASMVDFVFTTDAECVSVYRDTLCHNRVFVLPFAAQPRINNPIEEFERKDSFNFAGSYYARYKQRSKNFLSLVNGITKHKDIDIFDRNFNLNLGLDYQFPPSLQKYVRGTLAYKDINKAYKGYMFALNINTVKHSPTMFARRAFELLACNTITVSNYARGIKNLLGDLVISTDDGKKASKELSKITASLASEHSFRLQGLRSVMSNHTYEMRFGYLCEKVFSNYTFEPRQLNVAVVAQAESLADVENFIKMYDLQEYKQKSLLVVTEIEAQPMIQKRKDIVFIRPRELKRNMLEHHLLHVDYISVFSKDSYYGPNFLLDLILATKYTQAPIIGKSAYYRLYDDLKIINNNTQYKPNQNVSSNRAIIRKDIFVSQKTASLFSEKTYSKNTLAIDEFSYCDLNGEKLRSADKKIVDALSLINSGTSLERIYKETEKLARDRKEINKAILKRAFRLRRTKEFASEL